MKYRYIILLLVICSLIACGYKFFGYEKEEIIEEAVPIRDKNEIVGMNYYITINSRKEYLGINTKLIESIIHYKDVSGINKFYVNFIIINNSGHNYYLKKIDVINNNISLRKYNYNYLISNKKKVFILFEKSVLNRINKDNLTTSIYFEKEK